MPRPPKIARSIKDLHKHLDKWRASGRSIALVPTMGALHAGHLALVRLAQKKADRVVVSIFVNPTQFSANEDLSRYPRDEEGDVGRLADVDANLVWIPPVDVMYPPGFSTRITPGSTAEGLEGSIRPGHFSGVATVCCKLFSQTSPDFAIFGEKDYQQLCVLKQMVRDLNLPLKIAGAPTVREPDGLALSSRNAFLTDAERKIAPALFQTLSQAADEIGGNADIAMTLQAARRSLIGAGFGIVDYIEVRDAKTLAEVTRAGGGPLRVLAAVRLGTTRLIDNVEV